MYRLSWTGGGGYRSRTQTGRKPPRARPVDAAIARIDSGGPTLSGNARLSFARRRTGRAGGVRALAEFARGRERLAGSARGRTAILLRPGEMLVLSYGSGKRNGHRSRSLQRGAGVDHERAERGASET